ncbi:MAG: RNA polymerase sigma factor [Actinomycetota bacterium]
MPSDEIHDVLADTFLTAWRRLEDLPDDALPWLFSIARGHIANRHRAQRRRRALQDKLSGAVHHTGSILPVPPSDEMIDAELSSAIRGLPELEREAFILVAWDGLDPARAARVVGCSPATFRVRVYRARRRLKGRLTEVTTARRSPFPRQRTDAEEAP